MIDTQPLIAYLRDHDLIDDKTEDQLRGIQDPQVLKALLLESKLFTDRELVRLESLLSGYRMTKRTTSTIDPVVQSIIPYEVARAKRIVCVESGDNHICVVTDRNRIDDRTLKGLGVRKNLQIEKTSPEHIDALLAHYSQTTQTELLERIEQTVKRMRRMDSYGTVKMSAFFPSDQKREVAEDLSTRKVLKLIISLAEVKHAEQVTLQSHSDKVMLRMKIAGSMYDIMALPKNIELSLLYTLQYVCDVPVGEITTPLEMKTRLLKELDIASSVEVRVIPTVTGYTIRMRMAAEDEIFVRAQSLGLQDKDTQVLYELYKRRTGSIVISGLTNSGKTFAYYQLLEAGKSQGVVSSLEEVVEFVIDGVNQVYWSRKPGQDIQRLTDESDMLGIRPLPHNLALSVANAAQRALVVTETQEGVIGYLKALLKQGLSSRDVASACELNMVCMSIKQIDPKNMTTRKLNTSAIATLENYCTRARMNEILRAEGLVTRDTQLEHIQWATTNEPPRLWNKIMRGVSGTQASRTNNLYIRALVDTEKIIASSYRKGQTLLELEREIKEQQKAALLELLLVRAFRHEVAIDDVIAMLRV